MLVLAAMLDVMILHTGGAESPYYAGLNLLMLGIGILVPWAPRWSIASSLVVIASYLATVAAVAPPAPARLANNLFFLASTALVTMLAAVIGDRLRWKEFRQRAALLGALQHKREFLARMSHELRTPLHVIVGYSDILLDGSLPAASAERSLVERLRERAVFLHRMISDLLDYQKVEAGKMEVHREPVRLDEMLSLVAGAFRPIAERKGLELEVDGEPALPPVITDRQRVEQILTNLVGNAVKFTDRGGVSLEICLFAEARDLAGFTVLAGEDAPETATAAGWRPHAAILVRDTGIGIPSRSLRDLAGDFQQLEDTGRYGGTGLGLSISRRLATLLGGRIAVRTEAGRGSTFALLLPLDGDVRAPGPPRPHEARYHGVTSGEAFDKQGWLAQSRRS